MKLAGVRRAAAKLGRYVWSDISGGGQRPIDKFVVRGDCCCTNAWICVVSEVGRGHTDEGM